MTLPSLISFQEDFLSGKPVKREYIHFSESNCQDLDIWIGRICRTVSLEFLHEVLFTILNELLVNGCKANAKRIFFKSIDLDIDSDRDYVKGLPLFKIEFGQNRESLFEALEKTPLKIFLEAKNYPHFIEFKITNNVKILEEERKRIIERIVSSEKYKNITDAYKESLDIEESSGLGIVLIHILLRNSGLKDHFFELLTSEQETSAIVRIPKLIIPLEDQNKIRNILIDEIESLPPIQPHILNLIAQTKDKDMEWASLAKDIQKDPAITAEILKLSNSPIFGGHAKVILIADALKRIGLKNIETILLTLGSKKILNSRYDKHMQVWEHSYKTSLYARFLGEEIQNFHGIAEIASVCGLLHDLGRFILLSLDLNILQQIRILRIDDSDQLSEWVEEYTMGITHSDIGYLLGKKWNFPEEILDVIKYHHKPWQCKTKNRILCEMIYLSDIFATISHGQGNFYTMEPEILADFGILDELKYQEILGIVKGKFGIFKKENPDLNI